MTAQQQMTSNQPRAPCLASAKTRSCQKTVKSKGRSLPPFWIRNVSVVVDVHVLEEALELLAGDGQASSFEGGLELSHVELSVAILVDCVEQGRELPVGALDEALELCRWLVLMGVLPDVRIVCTLILDLAVTVAVDLA